MTLKEYVEEIQRALNKLPYDQVDRAILELKRARASGSRVYLFGNGGSAANASHWAQGLQSARVRAYALDSVPTITAIANDSSYDLVFVTQLRSFLTPGDVAIGFSCSGHSKNVVHAADYATQQNAITVGLTAFSGGMLKSGVDIPIHIPVDSYEVSEDIHSIIGHMIALRLRE